MKRISVLAIAILVLAIILGASFGLLIQSDTPPDQGYFAFDAFAVRTSEPISCSSIPQTYTDWLGINVIGNRTGMSFSSVTIYATGLNIRVGLPLNQTAFVEYKVTNSTLETIIAPLPNYFNSGTVLTLALVYSIANYPPNTVTLTETPVTQGTLNC
jgi:hypothetical protein